MKKQNPLYVVKKDYVEEAQGMIDLMIKKLNLAPVVDFLMSLLKMILENIRTYSMFAAVEGLVEQIFQRLQLFYRFSI